jgi:glycosyltransferase involved in cell wall biosynthesis
MPAALALLRWPLRAAHGSCPARRRRRAGEGAWWAAARAAPAGIPLVASEHNQYLWPGRPHSAEMREALGRVDVVFAHGPSARATVIAHGLPLERVREGISPVVGTRAREAPGLPSPRIVFAGRLDPDKGPDILVEALGLLRDPPPTLILGDGRCAVACSAGSASSGSRSG